jgi:hypothetical protein
MATIRIRSQDGQSNGGRWKNRRRGLGARPDQARETRPRPADATGRLLRVYELVALARTQVIGRDNGEAQLAIVGEDSAARPAEPK